MNFWSVQNVQKYYNCINPSLSTVKKISCHTALEVLWVNYLNCFLRLPEIIGVMLCEKWE